MHRWIALLAAVIATIVVAQPANAVPPDPPADCRVNQPPGLWPGDYVDLGSGEWDTNLHHGLNSDFAKHVRPIGHVKALMIFVDFEDALASYEKEIQKLTDGFVKKIDDSFALKETDILKV